MRNKHGVVATMQTCAALLSLALVCSFLIVCLRLNCFRLHLRCFLHRNCLVEKRQEQPLAADGTSSAWAPPPHFDNLDLGVPGKCDQVVNREGYAIGYVEEWEQPSWVAYRLTKNEVMSRKASRLDSFMADPLITTGSATLDDYKGSGFDRGHLAPAGDMHWSDKVMLESFYMSNMSPQNPSFNRGAWARLEQAVRRFAYAEGSVFVVTGPIVTEDDNATIGANKVRVPGFYYKAIYDETPPEKMIAFILPNRGTKKSLDSFVVSVDDVEEATGLNFFSQLPQDIQMRLESNSEPDKWAWRDERRGGRE